RGRAQPHAEHAADQVLVVAAAAGQPDRAAEDVGEHQDEDDRHERDVGQGLGLAPDPGDAPPGQHGHVGDEQPGRALPVGGILVVLVVGQVSGAGGHAALLPSSSASAAAWPVSEKKTSSRDARCSVTSVARTPAAPSERTTPVVSPSASRTGTVRRSWSWSAVTCPVAYGLTAVRAASTSAPAASSISRC